MIRTLGQLRAELADLPDDTVILMENEEHMRYYDIRIRWRLEPVLEHGWAVLLEPGQCWNAELDLDARIDAKLGDL